MGTDQDSASPGAGQGTLDAGLLGLVAEIAALDAVALMVRKKSRRLKALLASCCGSSISTSSLFA